MPRTRANSSALPTRSAARCYVRHIVLLAGLAVAGGLVTAPSSALASATSPPTVPACYSSVGACEGIFLKAPIGAAKKTGALHSVVQLTGPAPLQFKTPVACGDAGCLYNHLNWVVGPGALGTTGCQPNTTTCSVKIAPGSSSWVPVLVNQNDYPVALFLLWTPAGAHTISGKVTARDCSDPAGCTTAPLGGVLVTAKGPHGGGTDVSSTSGRYEISVARGKNYEVTPNLSDTTFSPEHRMVDVTHDVGGVDFVAESTCPVGSLSSATAAQTSSCPRPTKITMFCEYRPKDFVSFTKITTQSCFVTVRDGGRPPHQNPPGSVSFRSASPDLIGIIDPNPCTLTASVSTGVTECQVTLGPGSNTKEGDTLAVNATYVPSDPTFKPSTTGFSAKYTPTLDPTNKVTAARAEAHLIAVVGSAGALSVAAPPTAVVAAPTAAAAGLLAVPFHYLQLPDEPPDPAYAQVFQPRFPRVGRARASSKPLSAALTALNRNNAAIEGWAGAEWNALNRSVIALQANDRAAFVTQLLAESKNEKMLAGLVAKLPAEMKAIARKSPARYRKASVGVSSGRLAALVKRARKMAAAQRKLFRTVGIPSAVATGVITGSHSAVTRKSVNGNAAANLKAIAAAEARLAVFLRRVSAIHAAKAQLYS